MPPFRPATIAALLGLLAGTAPLAAQYDRPPERGGRVFRLGMPPIWKGNAGATVGWYDRGGEGLLQTHGHLGLMRDIGSPIVGNAAIGAEGYGGYRGDRSFNGGVRGLFSIPSFRLTTGIDYNVSDQSTSGIIRVELATRRLKTFVEENGIAYRLIEVDTLDGSEQWAATRELAKYNPQASYPTAVIEDVIAGYDIDALKAKLL